MVEYPKAPMKMATRYLVQRERASWPLEVLIEVVGDMAMIYATSIFFMMHNILRYVRDKYFSVLFYFMLNNK